MGLSVWVISVVMCDFEFFGSWVGDRDVADRGWDGLQVSAEGAGGVL